jgi:hypothetical protein
MDRSDDDPENAKSRLPCTLSSEIEQKFAPEDIVSGGMDRDVHAQPGSNGHHFKQNLGSGN